MSMKPCNLAEGCATIDGKGTVRLGEAWCPLLDRRCDPDAYDCNFSKDPSFNEGERNEEPEQDR